jgi:Family of unknown function (DUF6644)
MSLFEICQAIEKSTISSLVRDSAFPYVEGAHVLALSLSIGTVMWFDLRLVGAAMRTRPVWEVFEDVKPWMFVGFGIMFSTGALLFAAHATKAYANDYFRVKLALLMLAGLNAVVYHVTIDRRRSEWGKAPIPPGPARMAGLVSLVLWFSVIAVGRIFAYSL